MTAAPYVDQLQNNRFTCRYGGYFLFRPMWFVKVLFRLAYVWVCFLLSENSASVEWNKRLDKISGR